MIQWTNNTVWLSLTHSFGYEASSLSIHPELLSLLLQRARDRKFLRKEEAVLDTKRKRRNYYFQMLTQVSGNESSRPKTFNSHQIARRHEWAHSGPTHV